MKPSRRFWLTLGLLLTTTALAADPIDLKNVEYAKVDGRPLTLHLSVPASAKPVPLVVYIHGGGWRAGTKDRNPSAQLTRVNFAAASIEYRLSNIAKFPAQIHDCKAAIRFLRANAAKYNIDPDHIGVWGSSAGGHLVALLGTSGDVKELEGDIGTPGVSSRIQAVVDFCGPSNLLSIGEQANLRDFNEEADSAVALLLGGAPTAKRDLAAQASPVTHATKDDPPFLILHGDADKTVPIDQSRELGKALRKAGVEVKLIELPGIPHNVNEGIRKDPRLALEIIAFLNRHLRTTPGAAPAKE